MFETSSPQVSPTNFAEEPKSERNLLITLRQAGEKFLEIGACDQRIKRLEVSEEERKNYKQSKDNNNQ